MTINKGHLTTINGHPSISACARAWQVQYGDMDRQLISSGTIWERKFGYSRAVRVGNVIAVAGTTAVDENGSVVGAGDPGAQARFIFQKIGRALAEAGASLEDVVRVRTFVTDISRWED